MERNRATRQRRNTDVQTIAAIFLAAAVYPTVMGWSSGHAAHAAHAAQPSSPLLESLRPALREVNPAIKHVAALELRAAQSDTPHVLIGWGVRGDRTLRGDFRDGLYRVFVFDAGLTRIERVLEVIKTPRWLDDEMHIDSISARNVVVRGPGSYGDCPLRRKYSLLN